MLASSRNTLIDLLRIMADHISEYSVAHSNCHKLDHGTIHSHPVAEKTFLFPLEVLASLLLPFKEGFWSNEDRRHDNKKGSIVK